MSGRVGRRTAPTLTSTSTSTPADGPLLEARSIRVRFGGIVALDGVDLSVGQGEVVGLVGPNGAGKSTLLDVLAGRRTPSEGRILLDGRDVTRSTPRERGTQGIGVVLQGGRVLGHLDVAAHLELGHLAAVRAGRTRRDATATAVASVASALEAEIDAPVRAARELPHAAQQWLELAMVLATRPRVLLLDEPTSGMDRVGRARTAALLQELRTADPSLAMIVVEHDPAFIREVADRVVTLAEGRIVERAVDR
jgi:ABC-type sugar transport system ATPase subunit